MSERANDAETTRFGAMAGHGSDFAAAETVQFGAVGSPTPVREPSRQPVDPPLFGGAAAEEISGTHGSTEGLFGDPAPAADRATSAGGSKKLLIIGAVVVVLAALGVGGGVFMLNGGGSTHAAASQKDIEAAIRNYFDVLRDKGMSAASAISCKEVRDLADKMSTPDQSDMRQDVVIEKITNMTIDGDSASADLTGHVKTTSGGQAVDNSSEINPVQLKREDGQWRMCSKNTAD